MRKFETTEFWGDKGMEESEKGNWYSVYEVDAEIKRLQEEIKDRERAFEILWDKAGLLTTKNAALMEVLEAAEKQDKLSPALKIKIIKAREVINGINTH
jgi:hypothetical protein